MKPYKFHPIQNICIYCGMSQQEMVATQAMNSCEETFGMTLPCKPGKHVKSINGDYCAQCGMTAQEIEIQIAKERDDYYKQLSIDTHTGLCLDDYDSEICQDCPSEKECLELKDKEQIHFKDIRATIQFPHSPYTREMFEKLGAANMAEAKTDEERKNYCKSGNGMAECMCAVDGIDWRTCRFKRKASRLEKCMYYRGLDGFHHCDNYKAQSAQYLSTSD